MTVFPLTLTAFDPSPDAAGITIICRPLISKLAGIPSDATGVSGSHTPFPLARSYARNLRSDPVATKTRPPAVTSGPPRGQCAPVGPFHSGISGRPATVPFGTCHLISPVLRSYAVSCDHGAPIAERFMLVSQKSIGDR